MNWLEQMGDGPLKAAALGIHCRRSLGSVGNQPPTPSNEELARVALEAALPIFVAAIDAIEIGAGSEHFKHGRETMRDDAISALQDLIHRTEVRS